MHETGIQALVFSSSAAIFGEPEYLPIDENHSRTPKNFYGFTKLEIENLMDWYEELWGMKFASLRYFNAAGYDIQSRVPEPEHDPQNLIPILMETARRKKGTVLESMGMITIPRTAPAFVTMFMSLILLMLMFPP